MPSAKKYAKFLGLIIGILVFLYFVLQGRTPIDLIPFGIGGLISGQILGVATYLITESWVNSYLQKHNQKVMSYTAFQQAISKYEIDMQKKEQWVRRQREDYWRSLSGVQFERELADVYRSLRYKVSMTPYTGDGGVDLLLEKDNRLTIVQCKAHSKKISISVARELVASMSDFKADDAIIACFEGVTKPVYEYIKDKRISIVTIADIVEMQTKFATMNPARQEVQAVNQKILEKRVSIDSGGIRHWSEKLDRRD